MSVILEILYRTPVDPSREERLTTEAAKYSGKPDFREEPAPDDEVCQAVCLTYEFPDRQFATQAAKRIRSLGEHVEGPSDYS